MDRTKCLTLHAFTEGAQYGLKAAFAFRLKTANLLATVISGQRRTPTNGRHFRASENECYTHLLLLDLKVGRDWAVRTEPHPRFYADTIDAVPIAYPRYRARMVACLPHIRKRSAVPGLSAPNQEAKRRPAERSQKNRRRREQTGRVMHVQRAASSFCPNMKKGPVW
jgi:hypothetical protein